MIKINFDFISLFIKEPRKSSQGFEIQFLEPDSLLRLPGESVEGIPGDNNLFHLVKIRSH
jgi:hypothetical protein